MGHGPAALAFVESRKPGGMRNGSTQDAEGHEEEEEASSMVCENVRRGALDLN